MEMPIPSGSRTEHTTALVILRTYLLEKKGIENADPLILLAEIAWDAEQKIADRLRAAIAILPYCHTPFKASEFINPDAGPQFVVQVLGNVEIPASPIGAPTLVIDNEPDNTDTE